MRFWWATQNKNYDDAIAEGTLWTCPRPNGRKLDNARSFIKELSAGDVVFHHAHSYLRAVSVVTDEWRNVQRPPAYSPARTGELDEGWLVKVRPVATDLQMHYTDAAKIIECGRKDAPFHRGARPAERFLSSLIQDEGLHLLDELGVAVLETDGAFLGRPDNWWSGQHTDSVAMTTLRTEQADLRRHLLNGKTAAACSMCGKSYPSRLLIAGHIKPRHRCTEEERKDFKACAMLICSIGCDTLFEWGYIQVDQTGRIRAGKDPETLAVKEAVSVLTSKHCLAFNAHTAASFWDHSGQLERVEAQP
ncbi:hypothetical protein ART_3413 [Arthrobacter sp. PAMC 25486]|uniref:hypothetical protein n=1 Tax=Arthrobacter sp. PAMC 25486 TaxID=1494608 RepID=UPI000535CE3D|nr:hypothetical protein [Arthrobacter sp. PAMC 25486]AIY03012.1 hypothetical protein ART_3413 [Arthrobacter sp. PAMC 25486]